MSVGNWMLMHGELFRIIARNADGSVAVANWSRPRLDCWRARLRRLFA